jgi:hypothetical protein
MTDYSSVRARGYRDRPITRFFGSVLSWFLFTLNFSLLAYSSQSVMSVGGSCASGGPYDIAVPCPDNVTAFLPWCVFGGLFAIAIAIALGQGFGTQVIMLAWPILFCSLGVLFLAAFFGTGDPTGLIIGVLFEAMGLAPLVIEFRGSVQRVFLGSVNLDGQRFYEGPRARKSLMSPSEPNPEGAVAPRAVDWLLSLGILIIAGGGGFVIARVWFGSVQ